MNAPFTSPLLAVRPEWTDYNGHLNMAYYHVLFDMAVDLMLGELGLGPQAAAASGSTIFTVQAQIHYLRELHAGAQVIVNTVLIDCDGKRLHYVQTMRQTDSDVISAVTENIVLHVDLRSRRAAPWPPETAQCLNAAVAAHAALSRPEQVGRKVALPGR